MDLLCFVQIQTNGEHTSMVNKKDIIKNAIQNLWNGEIGIYYSLSILRVERFKCNFIIWFDPSVKQPRLLEVGGVQLADVRRFEFDGFSQGNLLWGLTTKPLEDFKVPPSVYVCSLLNNTQFSRQQNFTKLQ